MNSTKVKDDKKRHVKVSRLLISQPKPTLVKTRNKEPVDKPANTSKKDLNNILSKFAPPKGQVDDNDG